MSYYAGNIPPPEKAGMFPPGAYPQSAAGQGTYLPAQSGLPSAAPQPGYPSMGQGYTAMPGYPPTSSYGAAQSAYPGISAPGAYQTMGYPSLASISSPSYPATQGYPSAQASAGYPGQQLASQSPYGAAPMPTSNPMYAQGTAYSMPMPAGRGYPMSNPMYPASGFSNPYQAPSPYRPPYQ